MTRIDDTTRLGYILGGKPVCYEEVYADLGISHRTYDRYIELLREHGYIVTTRTPRGLTVAVTKAKKGILLSKKGYANNGESVASDTTNVAHQKPSDTPEVAERYDKNGESNIRDNNENINTYAQIFEKLKSIIQPSKPNRDGVKYTDAYGKLIKKALKTYSEDELIVSATFFVSQFQVEGSWHAQNTKYRSMSQFLGNTADRIPRWWNGPIALASPSISTRQTGNGSCVPASASPSGRGRLIPSRTA